VIDKLLIANRGEIACRIARTCRRLGIGVVAVFTEVDREALWVRQAEQAFRVPSYLDSQSLLQAAKIGGAQAVHPGFGFLAENVEFARAVQAAGLIWVGPTPASMELLASKEGAKHLAQRVNVPVLTSMTADQATYPLMIKALAGGGGKGMRRVDSPAELEAALQSARSEAARAFGDDRVLLEPLLKQARHIEVQVLGDRSGQRIHLGERDCSLQRRHQKILEESPATHLSPELRQKLHQAALRLASAAGYENAGTVEFLVQGEQFYFLEMNTRLQVEHPVTEAVTGLDLVEWQLRLAQGESLPWTEMPLRGHAVEVRLYAEDPVLGHVPCPGPVLLWEPPGGEVRVESALISGDQVTSDYDPMLAKLVAWGEDRDTALRRLRRAMEQTVLLGVASNRDFLIEWLGRAHFETFSVDTLDGHQARPAGDSWALWAAVAARWLELPGDPWRNLPGEGTRWHFEGFEPIEWDQPACGREGDWLWLEREGQRRRFRVVWHDREVWVASAQAQQQLTLVTRQRQARALPLSGVIVAPLTGSIVEVLVQAGQAVCAGQTLVRLEAMKMEHRVTSPIDGVVGELHCQVGEVVQARALLVKLA
jgi:acetyl/propionyl-CoA carboxylase alpha subunit